jgi:outer membrane murein-binding lipoprotein Lpp
LKGSPEYTTHQLELVIGEKREETTMLHIFDHKSEEVEPPGGKKPTLSRLQTVLSTPERVAAGEPPKANGEPASPQSWRRGGAAVQGGNGLGPAASPVATAVQARSSEFDKFAEEFTKSFLAAVSRAVEDIHGLVAQDRGTVELLATDHRELSARVGRLEERVAQMANHDAVEAMLKEIQKRLDLQASAIRAIHAANQARDEKLEKLISAFQGLQALTGAATGPAVVEIPDSL